MAEKTEGEGRKQIVLTEETRECLRYLDLNIGDEKIKIAYLFKTDAKNKLKNLGYEDAHRFVASLGDPSYPAVIIHGVVVSEPYKKEFTTQVFNRDFSFVLDVADVEPIRDGELEARVRQELGNLGNLCFW